MLSRRQVFGKVTRRNFLRGLGALAIVPPGLVPAPGIQLGTKGRREAKGYARAGLWGIKLHNEPSEDAPTSYSMYFDDLLPYYAEVKVDGTMGHNKLWYEVDGGYIHSAFIQPTQWIEQAQESNAPPDGFWAEVTVPYTDALIEPSLDAKRTRYRYYYETTYKVVEVKQAGGEAWYRVEDEIFPGQYWVRGRHMRRIPDSEVSTLSPDVDPAQKRLVVDVTKQMVSAYEGQQQVFEARCATGKKWDARRDFRTSIGDFSVWRKTPTQHMSGGWFGSDDYFDLPGIPWVSYFTLQGVAFHGAYWHNDYGTMRSHGCINLTPQNAKWVYRWSLPVADPALRYTWAKPLYSGTRVDVIGTYKD